VTEGEVRRRVQPAQERELQAGDVLTYKQKMEITASVITIWDESLIKYGLTEKLMEKYSYALNLVNIEAEVELNSYEIGYWFKAKVKERYND